MRNQKSGRIQKRLFNIEQVDSLFRKSIKNITNWLLKMGSEEVQRNCKVRKSMNMRFVSWLEVVLISSKDFSQHDPSKRCRILSGQVRDSLIRRLKGLTSRRAPTAFEDSQPKFRQLLRISRKISWNQIERHLFIFLLLAVLIRFQNYFLPAKKKNTKENKNQFFEKKNWRATQKRRNHQLFHLEFDSP